MTNWHKKLELTIWMKDCITREHRWLFLLGSQYNRSLLVTTPKQLLYSFSLFLHINDLPAAIIKNWTNDRFCIPCPNLIYICIYIAQQIFRLKFTKLWICTRKCCSPRSWSYHADAIATSLRFAALLVRLVETDFIPEIRKVKGRNNKLKISVK